MMIVWWLYKDLIQNIWWLYDDVIMIVWWNCYDCMMISLWVYGGFIMIKWDLAMVICSITKMIRFIGSGIVKHLWEFLMIPVAEICWFWLNYANELYANNQILLSNEHFDDFILQILFQLVYINTESFVGWCKWQNIFSNTSYKQSVNKIMPFWLIYANEEYVN